LGRRGRAFLFEEKYPAIATWGKEEGRGYSCHPESVFFGRAREGFSF